MILKHSKKITNLLEISEVDLTKETIDFIKEKTGMVEKDNDFSELFNQNLLGFLYQKKWLKSYKKMFPFDKFNLDQVLKFEIYLGMITIFGKYDCLNCGGKLEFDPFKSDGFVEKDTNGQIIEEEIYVCINCKKENRN